jgi:hypothetical protein
MRDWSHRGSARRASLTLDDLAAQCCNQLRQEAGEFAGHQGKVGVELLVGMFSTFLGFVP